MIDPEEDPVLSNLLAKLERMEESYSRGLDNIFKEFKEYDMRDEGVYEANGAWWWKESEESTDVNGPFPTEEEAKLDYERLEKSKRGKSDEEA